MVNCLPPVGFTENWCSAFWTSYDRATSTIRYELLEWGTLERAGVGDYGMTIQHWYRWGRAFGIDCLHGPGVGQLRIAKHYRLKNKSSDEVAPSETFSSLASVICVVATLVLSGTKNIRLMKNDTRLIDCPRPLNSLSFS